MPTKKSAQKVDMQNEKMIAALAYILFFVPLLTTKTPFTLFHANQGLNLLLLAIAVNVIGTVLPVIGWFILLPLGNIAVLVFAVLGIINALNGEKKELPFIGKYKLVDLK